jgi:hypothetical protein
MASLNDIETKTQYIFDILAGRSISTIKGTLPLTFTAKGGTAVDWVIYGNDNNGTENIFNIEKYVAGARIINYGISKIASTANEISVTPNSNYSTWYTALTRKKSDGNMPQTAGTQLIKIDVEGEQVYTLNLSSNNPLTGTLTYTNENFEILNENYILFSSVILPFTFTTPQGTRYIFIRFGNDNVDSDTIITNIMLVKGSTAPDHYIPHQQGVGEQRVDGYYVPLTISQQGQSDKTVDIYIGDSPLTEGETVSKTSTGVDIELFEGENTVSTTLYNKPAMDIKYKEYKE